MLALQRAASAPEAAKPAVAPVLRNGPYSATLARSASEILEAQRLRFLVFNLELNEGLPSAFLTGHDRDRFDQVCDHIIVRDDRSGSVVGTYRLQSGIRAGSALGYYSAQQFDFAPLEHLRPKMVELGRACIHRDHRSFAVLSLLWRAIASYANDCDARYLIGCSSLTSQDEDLGLRAYEFLTPYLAPKELRTTPLSGFELRGDAGSYKSEPHIPRLLRAYLAVGAQICGPPAMDREFKTIDFLTLLDLHDLSAAARTRFVR